MSNAISSAQGVENELIRLSGELRRLAAESRRELSSEVARKANQLLSGSTTAQLFTRFANHCIDASFHLFELGDTQPAIDLMRCVAVQATRFSDLVIERRVSSVLGGQYADVADYPKAMTCFKAGIEAARHLDDALGEAACIVNAAATLQDMGHHEDAIALATRALKLEYSGDLAAQLKLQASSIGLFSAYRLKKNDLAQRFLVSGEAHLSTSSRALSVAFFERNRALFLIDSGRLTEASRFIDDALRRFDGTNNPRVGILLRLAQATCAWSNSSIDEAKSLIAALYAETSTSRLYHSFVLQGALKIFSDSRSADDAQQGLQFAKELVEFTTKVKRAKFYRQIAGLSDAKAEQRLNESSFGAVTDFQSFIVSSGHDEPPASISKPDSIRKHDELTAIHEEIATLRVEKLRREIKTAAVDTAENWAIAAEFFDDETGQHCYRVGHLAGMLAREVGMDESFCLQLEHAARLHDIGKIAVNEVILLKPGPLNAAEMAAMRLHTEIGAQILQSSQDETLRMAVDIARHHHEWWNGGGYPQQLSGEEIPIAARLCAYADVYDALTHARVYKRAWTHEQALDELERLNGLQFDPRLAAPFGNVIQRYKDDLRHRRIPGFMDLASNALLTSRADLMETLSAPTH